MHPHIEVAHFRQVQHIFLTNAPLPQKIWPNIFAHTAVVELHGSFRKVTTLKSENTLKK